MEMTQTTQIETRENETGTSTWLLQEKDELLASRTIQDRNANPVPGFLSDLRLSWLQLRSVRHSLLRPPMT